MDKKRFHGFCQELIRIKSLSGQEKLVAERIACEMERLGYDEIVVDEYGSICGKVNGIRSSEIPPILFEGHMDTVDTNPKAGWQFDPFGAEIREGRLYGRGSADMKGALAAMIYGIGDLAVKDSAPPQDTYVAALVYEEIFEGCALAKVLDRINPGCVILGEPNNLSISYAQKGRAEVLLTTFGRNAHSAFPNQGINAINSMRALLDELDTVPLKKDAELGLGERVLTDIISTPYPGSSVVPDRCQVTFDVRLLPDESESEVLSLFQKAIDRLKSRDRTFKAAVCLSYDSKKCYTGNEITATRFFPAWKMPIDSILSKRVVQAFHSLGLKEKYTIYQFCTDGSESAGRRGIPTLGVGPSPSDLAHKVDEYVELNELDKARSLYKSIAQVHT